MEPVTGLTTAELLALEMVLLEALVVPELVVLVIGFVYVDSVVVPFSVQVLSKCQRARGLSDYGRTYVVTVV